VNAVLRYVVFTAFILAIVWPQSALPQPRDIVVEPPANEKRVALVVGNAAYPSSPLRNPLNDARAMARMLRDLRFDVLVRENATEKELKRAVEDFGDRLRGGGVGLFFFAGHGIQVAGRNYLVPIDAVIRNERDVEIEAVDVGRVLARMEDARNRLNIVVLDACRDNPFGRSFRSATRGLAAADAPSGTLVAYATSPGRLARDGDGANGLYTGELLKAMSEPGLNLWSVFTRVTSSVWRQTNGEQVPWVASSVEGDFIFRPLSVSSRVAAAPPPSSSRLTIREESRVGSIAFSSITDGVEVWLDDERLGEIRRGRPLVIENVAEGSHRLRAQKSGYDAWTQELQVSRDQRHDIEVRLQPAVTSPAGRSRTSDIEVSNVAGKVQISRLDPSGPAGRAGLQIGDIITSVKWQAVRDADHFREMLRGIAEHEMVNLQVERPGYGRFQIAYEASR